MTYREKLKKERPDLDHEFIFKTYCPTEYMDVACHPECGLRVTDFVCDKCWNQEFIEPTTEEKETIIPPENNENSCDICIHSKVCKFRDDFVKSLELIKNLPDEFEVIIRCKNQL